MPWISIRGKKTSFMKYFPSECVKCWLTSQNIWGGGSSIGVTLGVWSSSGNRKDSSEMENPSQSWHIIKLRSTFHLLASPSISRWNVALWTSGRQSGLWFNNDCFQEGKELTCSEIHLGFSSLILKGMYYLNYTSEQFYTQGGAARLHIQQTLPGKSCT